MSLSRREFTQAMWFSLGARHRARATSRRPVAGSVVSVFYPDFCY
jgi:hypothetical protein